MFDRINRLFEKSRRDKHRFGILFVDLNDFKIINDHYGHLIGDKVLILISDILLDSIRPFDMVSRYGGDEFIILIEHIKDESELSLIRNRISKSIELNEMTFNGTIRDLKINITASIGTASSNTAYNAENLIGLADLDLYEQKRLKNARK